MRALWSDRHNCSHNVSQKVKHISCFSDCSHVRGVFLTFPGIFGDFSVDPQKDSFGDLFAILGPEGRPPPSGRLL